MKSLSRELWSSSAKISNAVAIIVAIIFSLCGPLKAQWVEVTPDSGAQCNQIVFVDSLRGYIAGAVGEYPNIKGALFATTNGGSTWIDKKTFPGELSTVSAISDSLVWVSGGGGVYRSTDCGKSWQPSVVCNYNLLTVQFVDSLNGWAIGGYDDPMQVSYGGIFHSTDGGITWGIQHGDTSDFPEYQGKGYFVDTLHGWAAQYVGVRRTTDGGDTWSPIIYAGGAENMQSVFFLDTLNGWAAGWHGIGKTTDGGVSWSGVWNAFPGSSVPQFNSVFFVDTSDGWVCDNFGGILHTTDGGGTWSTQRSDTSGYPALNSIFFLNKNDGWAVGNGIILHTTNGGVTAVNQPPPQPKSFRLMQNYPNPFNPSTTINYELSVNGRVTLKIYDILGRQVATLVDEKQTAGVHTITWKASRFSSGVYFYRLVSTSSQGTFVGTRQMLMIK